jgi:hypothetical protein
LELFRFSSAQPEFSSEDGESPIHKFVATCTKLNANDRLDTILIAMKRGILEAEHTPSREQRGFGIIESKRESSHTSRWFASYFSRGFWGVEAMLVDLQ